MEIIIIILLLILLGICLLIFSGDIMSPSSIVCISYILAVSCAIINIDVWGFNLHRFTCIAVLLAIVVFILGEGMAKLSSKNHEVHDYSFPIPDLKITLIFVALEFVILILYYNEVKKIAGSRGTFSSISEMMFNYKVVTYWSSAIENNINVYVNQISKFIIVVVYEYVFVIISCLVNKVNILKIKYIFLPLIPYIPYVILVGGRLPFIRLACASLILFRLIYGKKHNWKLKKSIGYVSKCFKLFIVIIVVFYLSRELVGRAAGKSNLVTYITGYLGGGLQLFDTYFLEDHISTNGVRTFAQIYSFLSKLGLSSGNIVRNWEFMTSESGYYGNVYTSLGRFMSDFGFLGTMILMFLEGFIISKLYYVIKASKSSKSTNLLLIIYSYISISLFLHSVDDLFYVLITPTFLVIIALFYFVHALIYKHSKIFTCDLKNKISQEERPNARKINYKKCHIKCDSNNL